MAPAVSRWRIEDLRALRAVADLPSGPFAPVFFLQLQPLRELKNSIPELARTVWKEEGFKKALGWLMNTTNSEHLASIDETQPWGIYARYDDVSKTWGVVALIPVRENAGFLALLQDLKFDKEEVLGDLLVFRAPPVPAELLPDIPSPDFSVALPGMGGMSANFTRMALPSGLSQRMGIRLANNYAHIMLAGSSTMLGGPEVAFAPKLFDHGDKAFLTATLWIDQIRGPDRALLSNLIRIVSSMEIPGVVDGKNRHYASTVMTELGKFAEDLLQDSRNISFRMNLDEAAKALTFDLFFQGKRGSNLERRIAQMPSQSKMMAIMPSEEPSMSFLFNLRLPEVVRTELPRFCSEATSIVVNGIHDPAEREHQEMVFKAIEPTFAAGALDAALALLQQEGNPYFSVVGALKVEKGRGIDEVLQKEADLPTNREARPMFAFNALNVGEVFAHRIDWRLIQSPYLISTYGEDPSFLAIGENETIWAAGPMGEPLLRQALVNARANRFPATGASLVRIAGNAKKMNRRPLAGVVIPDEGQKMLTNENPGRFRFELLGGDSLRLHFGMELSFLNFAARTVFLPR